MNYPINIDLVHLFNQNGLDVRAEVAKSEEEILAFNIKSVWRQMEAIARRFEMSQRQAQKYALVWKAFFDDEDGKENVNVDALLLDEPSWYVVAATETKEPEKWLAYAQDRKMEDARYSVASFRRDIQQAHISNSLDYADYAGNAGPESMESTPLPTVERRECPWIQPFCTRTGRPVRVEECTGCEFTGIEHQAAD